MDYRTRDARFEKERLTLDKIYDLLPVGKETVSSSSEIYNAFAEPISGTGQFTRYIHEIEDAGIFKRRYTLMAAGRPGKVAYWTLLVDRDKAHELLQRHQTKREDGTAELISAPRKNKRKQQEREQEDTVAIVGPDMPTIAEAMPQKVRDLRKEEAGALLEAARQYANRKNSAMAKLQELAKTMEELGIKFDADKAAAAMHFEEDERLETIALVVSYVDRLERVNEQLALQITEMRPKVAKYDEVARDNERLTLRVERLVSQQVMSPH